MNNGCRALSAGKARLTRLCGRWRLGLRQAGQTAIAILKRGVLDDRPAVELTTARGHRGCERVDGVEPRALADDEAIACRVERATRGPRAVVALRQRRQAVERAAREELGARGDLRERRDVAAAHDRFRRCYLGNGRTINLCRCMAHVDPHLHAPHKLTRIGHLPMFTMKELPE